MQTDGIKKKNILQFCHLESAFLTTKLICAPHTQILDSAMPFGRSHGFWKYSNSMSYSREPSGGACNIQEKDASKKYLK